MISAEQQAARHHLNRAVMDDAYGLYTDHPWFWEGARWTELLFSICVRVVGIEEAEVREMIVELNDLDLMEVQELAALPRDSSGMADTGTPTYQAICETMARYGLDDDRIQRTVTAFADAARSLSGGFQGKVQKYIRSYGERMIAELDQHFRFTELGANEMREAFTEWLQNCLAMPLSLRDADMREFCEARGITLDALVEAADAADINVAYLDDITRMVMNTVPAERERAGPEPMAGE